MSRICEHILDEKETNCKICGTSILMMNNGYMCVWRDVPDERTREIRPEPKERQYAVYDVKTISRRLLELEQEKSLAINYISEEDLNSSLDGSLT